MLLFSKIVGLVGLLLGSWEDIRTREVPDWLNFSMIFIGVGSALIFSIARNDYSIVVSSLAGLIVCVALAYFMFYTAQWGGGDSKLLMAMGALVGLDVMNLEGVPLLMILLLNIMLVGALYGLFWSLYLAIANWKDFRKSFKDRLYSPEITMVRKVNLGIMFLLLISLFFVPLTLKTLIFGVMLFLYASIYLWVFVKSVEDSCMVKEVDIDGLVEGDWIVKTVEIEGEKIVGPDDLGIKKNQLERLKELKDDKKVEKVWVKEGVPFVPSFLLGFIVTLVFGNWIIYLI